MSSITDLATFISLNIPHSDASTSYIDSIIASRNVGDNLKKATDKLNLSDRTVFLTCNTQKEPEDFLKTLYDNLNQEKIIFIDVGSGTFDPIIFDQLARFRQENSFLGYLHKYHLDMTGHCFPVPSHIFLLFQIKKDEKPQSFYYELTDRVIDIRN